MKKKHHKTVWLFRRDLRLEDNLGLLQALETSTEVVPCFVFDPRQCNRDQNEYFSEPAFAFLLASLHELDQALQARGSRLYVFHGNPAEIVTQLIDRDEVTAVMMNKDYTPFARTRDRAIADVCASMAGKKDEVFFARHDDPTPPPIETIRTGSDTLYTVFTPFMKNAAKHAVPQPRKNNFDNYFSGRLHTKTVDLSDFTADIGSRKLLLQGGRTEALQILHQASDYLTEYEETRNLPATHGTSRLSAHHKFGTISVRETFHTAKSWPGDTAAFISELYWRDFYLYIAQYFPVVFGASFLPWAQHIEWINNQEQFAAWCEGRTGVPIVDAAMRELNHTGWMHNRSRMIVASYLTKNLLIDWRWGERYFAQHLIDYDPAANNGGWQWSASTGADPKPLRIFNPYTQAQKFDKQAAYIKQWVPELAAVEDKLLTDGKTQDFGGMFLVDYPSPLVDQKESYHRTMAAYKKAKAVWRATQPVAESA